MCNAQFVIRSTPLIAKRRYSVRMKPEDTAILEYPARPDQPATASLAAARQVLDQAVAARAFPGAAFGVLCRNQIAIDAVGRFTYDSNAPAVRPDTVFDIASVSKVVATTTAAMILYDRGLLDLDTPIGDILPGFVVGMEHGSGKDRVTLRMLLAHNSGLPGYVTFFRDHWAQAIGEVLPVTHFLRIVRGLLLKGNGLPEIWPELWPLALFMAAAGAVAMARFRRTLD